MSLFTIKQSNFVSFNIKSKQVTDKLIKSLISLTFGFFEG